MKIAYSARLILFLVIFSMPLAYALTASMGNARMVIRANVTEGEITTIDKEIQVNNVNEYPIIVTLTSSKELEDIVTIADSEFVMQPDETKFAKFQINLEWGGTYDGKIFVSFAPEDKTMKQSPVGLASRIIILAEGPQNPNPPADDNETITDNAEDIAEDTSANNETIDTNEDTNEEPKDDELTGETDNRTDQNEGSKGPNPLVGLILIIVILIAGVIVYKLIRRGKK